MDQSCSSLWAATSVNYRRNNRGWPFCRKQYAPSSSQRGKMVPPQHILLTEHSLVHDQCRPPQGQSNFQAGSLLGSAPQPPPPGLQGGHPHQGNFHAAPRPPPGQAPVPAQGVKVEFQGSGGQYLQQGPPGGSSNPNSLLSPFPAADVALPGHPQKDSPSFLLGCCAGGWHLLSLMWPACGILSSWRR